MQISLKTVLENRNFNKDTKEWESFETEKQIEYFQMFKEWLMAKCRKDSKVQKAIYYTGLEEAKKNNCGLFGRLIIENEKVTYICGQSWNEEIATLKKQFSK